MFDPLSAPAQVPIQTPIQQNLFVQTQQTNLFSNTTFTSPAQPLSNQFAGLSLNPQPVPQ